MIRPRPLLEVGCRKVLGQRIVDAAFFAGVIDLQRLDTHQRRAELQRGVVNPGDVLIEIGLCAVLFDDCVREDLADVSRLAVGEVSNLLAAICQRGIDIVADFVAIGTAECAVKAAGLDILRRLDAIF